MKPKDIKPTREDILLAQHGCCALCGEPLLPSDACLDHNHETGLVRAVLHRSCNSGLGAVERVKRYGIKDVLSFAQGAARYLERHAVDRTGLLHSTWRTVAERKARVKKRAKKRRASVR